ncbi:acyltransferase family protein (plasmid) [Streptomyces sp. BI20]|uniref:acyltransferase family protein n=1 Tax=Streptomyces sp. BI20 TaxID=3403460 RepID=UPI003C767F69
MRRLVRWDALRGLAVLLVMARHAAPDAMPGAGVVGVVVFFALSGHLITTLLLRELDAEGGIRFGAFHLKRATRLLPALVVMMAGFVLVTLLWDPAAGRGNLPRALLVAFTYTADLPVAHGSDAIFHLWTLALEMQFYLLWPPLLLWAHRRGRTRPLVAGSLVALTLVGVGVALYLGHDFDRAYPWPTSWGGAMLIGAAYAVLRHERENAGPSVRRRHAGGPFPGSFPGLSRAVAPGAVLLLLAASLVPWRSYAGTYPWAGLGLAALTVVLMDRWAREERPTGRVLTTLARVGTVSYAAYLWNYPLTLWLRPWHPVAGPVLAIALTLVLAALSWRLVERPALRRARRTPAYNGTGGDQSPPRTQSEGTPSWSSAPNP